MREVNLPTHWKIATSEAGAGVEDGRTTLNLAGAAKAIHSLSVNLDMYGNLPYIPRGR